MEAEIPKCGRNAENAERYRKDRWDLASTYVLRPRLGIKCPGFQMVRKNYLGKEWIEGVRTEYRIPVKFDYKLESRFVDNGKVVRKVK